MASKKRKPAAPKPAPERSKPIEARTQETPDLRTPGAVELEYREGFGHIWPEAVPLPGRWHVRVPIPCPECKRVYLAEHQQAVMCKNVTRTKDGGVAYLQCRGCGHKYKMPILLV